MPDDRALLRREYADRLAKLIEQGEKTDAVTARELYKMLEQARREVRSILAQAPTDWKLTHYGVLDQRIKRAMDKLRAEFTDAVRDGVKERFGDGVDVTDEMLDRFSGERQRRNIPVDRRQLNVLQGFSADLITNVTDETINKISTQLKLGMMGGRTPYDVMRRVAGTLDDPGVFGDLMTRAEMIVRTEQGRAYAVAQQSRLEDWNEADPGLMKLWLAVGGPRTRPSHARAGRDYGRGVGADPGPIPVKERFVLHVESDTGEASKSQPAGEYECLYPRDPALPPGLSVACRCGSVAWRADWFRKPKTREALSALVEAARLVEVRRPEWVGVRLKEAA